MSSYTVEIRLEGIDALSDVMRSAERDVDQASRNIERSLGGVKNEMEDVSRVGQRSFEDVGRAMQDAGDNMQNFARDVRPVATAMAGIGAAITGIIGVGVKKFADFESAMARVRAVSGATDDEFQQLEGIAREMGETTKYTAHESAEALAYMAMAGMDSAEMLEALPRVLNLAAASGMELGQSADIITNIMRGMNIETDQLTRVNDVLVKTLTSSNVKLEELGKAFAYAAPAAARVNMPLEEVAMVIGKMGDAGIKSSRAGTALEAMIRQMSRVTPAARKEMDRLGITFADSEGNMLPIADVIEQIVNISGELEGNLEENRVMIEIFGQAGARAIGALTSAGVPALREFQDELMNCEGVAEKTSEVMQDTLAGSFTRLKSAVEGALIEIGQEFAPMVRKVADLVKGAVDIFNQMPESLRKIIVWVTGVIGVLLALGGGLLLILGPLGALIKSAGVVIAFLPKLKGLIFGVGKVVGPVVGFLPKIVKMIGGVIGAVGKVGGALGKVLLFLGPKGWIILAVIGLLTGLVLLVKKYWDQIWDFLTGIIDAWLGLVGEVVDIGRRIVVGFWEGISGAASWLFDKIVGFGQSVWDAFKTGLGTLWPFSPSEAGVNVGEGLIEGICAGIKSAESQLDRELVGLENKVGSSRPRLEYGMAGAGGLVVNGPLVAFYDTHVASDQELEELFRKVNKEVGKIRRGIG